MLTHLLDTDLPLWLARLHRSTAEGTVLELSITPGPTTAADGPSTTVDRAGAPDAPVTVADVVMGGGFVPASTRPDTWMRARSLADWVAADMRVLMVGLNPSPTAAEQGVAFARPGNRFWPAALAAGLVSVDRDPEHALVNHGIGFTDLSKRTTTRASELSAAELAAGLARLTGLVRWLQPGAVCVLGLTGWRQTVDPVAVAGWQEAPLGPSPVYLMPNPSGLNAHARPADFVHHLGQVASRLATD
jgi:TDG/mug DNA glycosylase family protein